MSNTKKNDFIGKADLMRMAAIFLLCCSLFFLYKGWNKMTKYISPDSKYKDPVNAYVGGDAYNYIINGAYSTGFFVLSMGNMITASVLYAGSEILRKQHTEEPKLETAATKPVVEKPQPAAAVSAPAAKEEPAEEKKAE